MLAGLADRVDELSELVAELSGSMSALRDRPLTAQPDGDATQPLRQQQQRLADELKTLADALDALPARTREIAETAADETARRVAGETARDAAAEALRAARADAAPVASTAPEPPSAVSAAELDRLIDAQLARLEKEYQRLATRVSSPAVRQADASPGLGDDADLTTPALSSPGAATAATAAQGSEPAGDLPAQITVGDRRYALQLIGFYNRAELDDFIARNPLPPQVYWREETFRGQPWFVLIHSLHADLAAAGEAQRGLPDALAGLDLWIRDLPSDARLNVIATGGD
jgi:DamX protein